MKPKEKRLVRMRLEPADRVIHALFRAALDKPKVFVKELFPSKCVIVAVKPAGEAPAAIEHERADDRAGRVAVSLEAFGEHSKACAQRLAGEILHPVVEGISASEDRSMRWPGEGYLSDRAFKDNAFLCQRVHVRRQVAGIPVATQAVGSQGVHGDDQNVWSPRFVLPAAARKQQNRQEEESQATREKNGGSPETGCPTDSGGRAHLRLGTPVGAFSYFFCFARLAIGFECL